MRGDDTHGAVDDVSQNCAQSPTGHFDLNGARWARLIARRPIVRKRLNAIIAHSSTRRLTRTARGQLLDTHVALEFAMELLAGAMRVIQGNDFVCTTCQVRPVGVDFDIGHEQAVVIVVVETFNHLECHGTGDW